MFGHTKLDNLRFLPFFIRKPYINKPLLFVLIIVPSNALRLEFLHLGSVIARRCVAGKRNHLHNLPIHRHSAIRWQDL